MIIISHATGSENSRQAALAFAEAGLLEDFWTTINWNPEAKLNRLLPKALRETFARRSFPPAVRARTHSLPAREAARLITGALHFPLFARHEDGLLAIGSVLRAVDRRVARAVRSNGHARAVYAYEDCAQQTFTAAMERALPRIYELPIGYWRAAQRIFEEERKREPEWAATLTGTRDSEEKLARKDDELRLATRVIVASSFTSQTLAESPYARSTEVIPYGAPAVSNETKPPQDGKLRVLFAGSLGQRKGLSYLLDAIALLDSKMVELTLLGRKAAGGCRPLDAAVRAHRWLPSLPHEGVLREMHEHDVLVFPSLFEGFGLVITEAMAQGTPVITTAHTAGPDIIADDQDGFIVPLRSSEAIAAKLELLAREPERRRAMGVAAQKKIAGHSWADYRRRIATMARDVMSLS